MVTCKFLSILAIASQVAALLPSPPRIVKQPPSEELLFHVSQPGETHQPFTIECEAEGEPAPKYKWYKNGKPFNYTSYDNRIVQQPGRGSLVVSDPRDDDIGQYQCFAVNQFGTATSNIFYVRKAELNDFNETKTETLTAQEGKPFKLTCSPPDGYPKPNVYWILQDEKGQVKTINDSRITLDPEGNLWFSNVTRYDTSGDLVYACVAKSLYEYKMGNRVKLIVDQTGTPTLNRQEPVRQYVKRKVETALKGRKIELYCIYGGTPLPQVVWSKNGRPIQYSQEITQDNYGKTLVIKQTTYEDQGTYTCEVSNGVGTAQSYSIHLTVEAAPFFIEEPQFLNMAEGETAEIRCRAGGTPAPSISWIYNGKPVYLAPYNDRRQVYSDAIFITDLTKSDTGNYGCNVTNSNGYVYRDVYINVQ